MLTALMGKFWFKLVAFVSLWILASVPLMYLAGWLGDKFWPPPLDDGQQRWMSLTWYPDIGAIASSLFILGLPVGCVGLLFVMYLNYLDEHDGGRRLLIRKKALLCSALLAILLTIAASAFFVQVNNDNGVQLSQSEWWSLVEDFIIEVRGWGMFTLFALPLLIPTLCCGWLMPRFWKPDTSFDFRDW